MDVYSLSNSSDVLNMFNKYFSNVVDEIINSIVFKSFWSEWDLFVMTFLAQSMFIEPVTPSEIAKIITTLNNNKAPSIDRISNMA